MRGFGPCWMTPATMSPSRPRNSPSTCVVGDVAQALVDDLLRGERGDAAEVVGAVLGLADDVALVVELGNEDGDVPGLAVELDACAVGQFAASAGSVCFR